MVWPAYGRKRSVRLAVGWYVIVVGTGCAALFGLRAFGTLYFEGVTWPLEVVRVCAFLTLPTCMNLVIVSLRLRGAEVGRRLRWHLHVIAASSVLMVVALLTVELIGFSRIT